MATNYIKLLGTIGPTKNIADTKILGKTILTSILEYLILL